jgi:PEP-CTERM/exosortase A-associated glycosyltransferase
LSLNPVVISSLRQPKDPSYKVKEFDLQDEFYDGIPYFRSIDFTSEKWQKKSKLPFLRELLEINTFAKNIDILIKKIKPDLIHAHSSILVGYAALKAARKNNLPIVYEIRAFWEDAAVEQGKTTQVSCRYHVSRYLETILLRKVDAVTVICEGLKKDIIKRGIPEEKIFVVRNGVDTERFFPIKKDSDLSNKLSLNGKKVLGFIGTLFHFEGIEILINAMYHLKNRDDIVCIIIGHGQSEEKLKTLIKEYNLEDKVKFLGKISNEIIESYYSIIDIFIYPRLSFRITELVTPLKPLEAMAMGKTVIASDVGGQKELINDGKDGLLFKAGDPHDLVEKILYVISNESVTQKYGRTARENMVKNRNWNRITEIYKKVYEYARSKHSIS